MRTHVTQALLVAGALLVALAGGARWRAHALDAQAQSLAGAIDRASDAFVRTFTEADHRAELALLDQRRALLESASRWERLGVLGVMAGLVALFAAWISRELRTFWSAVELEGDPPSSPPRQR